MSKITPTLQGLTKQYLNLSGRLKEANNKIAVINEQIYSSDTKSNAKILQENESKADESGFIVVLSDVYSSMRTYVENLEHNINILETLILSTTEASDKEEKKNFYSVDRS